MSLRDFFAERSQALCCCEAFRAERLTFCVIADFSAERLMLCVIARFICGAISCIASLQDLFA